MTDHQLAAFLIAMPFIILCVVFAIGEHVFNREPKAIPVRVKNDKRR